MPIAILANHRAGAGRFGVESTKIDCHPSQNPSRFAAAQHPCSRGIQIARELFGGGTQSHRPNLQSGYSSLPSGVGASFGGDIYCSAAVLSDSGRLSSEVADRIQQRMYTPPWWGPN